MLLSMPAPKILDWDIENRPISYGFDWTTADVTAIAAGWADQEQIDCWLVRDSRHKDDYYVMLENFRRLYDKADIVTGHYIRGHDLPIINGAMLEFGFPPLSPKMTIDTKNDLIKFKDLGKSQEALSEMLGVVSPKDHVTPTEWRWANRLQTPSVTRRRVMADVKQHKEMRLALVAAGALKSPKVWRP